MRCKAVAVAVAVALAVLAACGEDDKQAATSPEREVPASMTTSAVDATTSTTTSPASTTTTTNIPEAAAPSSWVGHDADHRLVVVDTETGAVVRVLAEFDDPETFTEETGEPLAGGAFLGDFSVTPDGATVFYERCCEPAPGMIYRVEVDGGAPSRMTEGAFPAVTRDGARLALVELQWLKIVDLATGEVTRLRSSGEGPMALQHLAWSPDGRFLAFERYDTSREGRVVVLEVAEGASLDDATTVVDADADGTPTLPTFDDEGRLHVVRQQHRPPLGHRAPATAVVVAVPSGEEVSRRRLPGAVSGQDHDRSGQHLIRAFADGPVRAWSPSGEPTRLGDGYFDVSW